MKYSVRLVCNFWKACYRSPDSEIFQVLRMSRVCIMLQWSSEFLCHCLLQANQKFASLNWQYVPQALPALLFCNNLNRYDVHLAYVDAVAEQKRLTEVFVTEYKSRDAAIARLYESYSDILLSYTKKDKMT